LQFWARNVTYFGRAVEDPAIIAQIAEILERQWDPNGVVRDGLQGDSDFYRAQAIVVAGMLSADARETEVQRYLRQMEEEALPATLHPAEVRHAIAVAAWRAARGL
jgi:hypothetical protein